MQVKELAEKLTAEWNLKNLGSRIPIFEHLARVALEFCEERELGIAIKYAIGAKKYSVASVAAEALEKLGGVPQHYDCERRCAVMPEIPTRGAEISLAEIEAREERGDYTEAEADAARLQVEVDRLNKENLSFHAQATGYYEETVRLKAQLEAEILRRDSLDETVKSVRAEVEQLLEEVAKYRVANEMKRGNIDGWRRIVMKQEKQLASIRKAAEPIVTGTGNDLASDVRALAEAIKEEK